MASRSALRRLDANTLRPCRLRRCFASAQNVWTLSERQRTCQQTGNQPPEICWHCNAPCPFRPGRWSQRSRMPAHLAQCSLLASRSGQPGVESRRRLGRRSAAYACLRSRRCRCQGARDPASNPGLARWGLAAWRLATGFAARRPAAGTRPDRCGGTPLVSVLPIRRLAPRRLHHRSPASGSLEEASSQGMSLPAQG